MYFLHFNHLKKVHTQPNTFFYTAQNTHITPFYTKIIFKSDNAHKSHHTNSKQTFSLI